MRDGGMLFNLIFVLNLCESQQFCRFPIDTGSIPEGALHSFSHTRGVLFEVWCRGLLKLYAWRGFKKGTTCLINFNLSYILGIKFVQNCTRQSKLQKHHWLTIWPRYKSSEKVVQVRKACKLKIIVELEPPARFFWCLTFLLTFLLWFFEWKKLCNSAIKNENTSYVCWPQWSSNAQVLHTKPQPGSVKRLLKFFEVGRFAAHVGALAKSF